MSSVDRRVVSIEMDNQQFENAAKNTISTLGKLEESMQFKGSTDGVDALQKSLSNVNFNALNAALDKVNEGFSVMGVMAKRVIEDITDSIYGFVKSGVTNIWNSTIGQIKSGGWTRASNLEHARHMLKGLGYEWSQVSDSIDYAVQDTAYGLDEAARIAAQFLASGVQTGEAMNTALRAVSGTAAMTNSSYLEMGDVFAKVAGQGKVMAVNLNQLAVRGLNGAATLANYLGTTEAEIRQMVHDGVIDFTTFAEAMDSAFGEHAKSANETFSGSVANIKASLSRLGAQFIEPLMKNMLDLDNLSSHFTDEDFLLGHYPGSQGILTHIRNFTKTLEKLVTPISKAFDELSRKVFDFAGGRVLDRFTDYLRHFLSDDTLRKMGLWDGRIEYIRETYGAYEQLPIVKWISDKMKAPAQWLNWYEPLPDGTGILHNENAVMLEERITNFAGRVRDFFKETKEFLEPITDRLKTFFVFPSVSVFDKLDDGLDKIRDLNDLLAVNKEDVDAIMRGDYGNGQDRIKNLLAENKNYWELQDLVNYAINGTTTSLHELSDEELLNLGYTREQIDSLRELYPVTEEQASAMETLAEMATRVIRGDFGNGAERYDALTEAGENYWAIQDKVNEMMGCEIGSLHDKSDAELLNLGYTQEQIDAMRELYAELEKQEEMAREMKKRKGLYGVITGIRDALCFVLDVWEEFKQSLVDNVSSWMMIENISFIIDEIGGAFYDVGKYLVGSDMTKIRKFFNIILSILGRGIGLLAVVVRNVFTIGRAILPPVLKIIGAIVDKVETFILKFLYDSRLHDFIVFILDLVTELFVIAGDALSVFADKFESVLSNIENSAVYQKVSGWIQTISDKIFGLFAGTDEDGVTIISGGQVGLLERAQTIANDIATSVRKFFGYDAEGHKIEFADEDQIPLGRKILDLLTEIPEKLRNFLGLNEDWEKIEFAEGDTIPVGRMLIDTIETLGTKIREFNDSFKVVNEETGKLEGGFFPTLLSHLSELAGFVIDGGVGVVEFVNGVVEGTANSEGFKAFVEQMNAFGETVSGWAGGVWDKIYTLIFGERDKEDGIEGAVKGIKGVDFKKMGEDVSTHLSGAFEELSERVESARTSLETFVGDLPKKLQAFFGLDEKWKKIEFVDGDTIPLGRMFLDLISSITTKIDEFNKSLKKTDEKTGEEKGGIFGSFLDVLGAVFNAIVTAGSSILGFINGLLETIGNSAGFKAFTEHLNNFFTTISGWAGSAWESIYNLFFKKRDGEDGAIGAAEKIDWHKLGTDVGTKVGEAFGWLSARIEDAKKAFENFKTWLDNGGFGPSITAFVDDVKEAFGVIFGGKEISEEDRSGNKILVLFDSLKEKFNEIKEALGNFSFDKLTESLGGIGEWVEQKGQSVLSFFETWIEKIIGTDNYEKLQEKFGSIKELVTNFFTDIWTFITGIFGGKKKEAATGENESVGEVIEETVDPEKTESVTDAIFGAGNHFLETIPQMWENIKAFFVGLWEDITSFDYLGKINELKESFEKKAPALIEVVTALFTSAIESIGAVFSAIGPSLAALGQGFWEAFMDAITVPLEGGAEGETRLKTIKELLAPLTETFAAVWDMITGLFKGEEGDIGAAEEKTNSLSETLGGFFTGIQEFLGKITGLSSEGMPSQQEGGPTGLLGLFRNIEHFIAEIVDNDDIDRILKQIKNGAIALIIVEVARLVGNIRGIFGALNGLLKFKVFAALNVFAFNNLFKVILAILAIILAAMVIGHMDFGNIAKLFLGLIIVFSAIWLFFKIIVGYAKGIKDTKLFDTIKAMGILFAAMIPLAIGLFALCLVLKWINNGKNDDVKGALQKILIWVGIIVGGILLIGIIFAVLKRVLGIDVGAQIEALSKLFVSIGVMIKGLAKGIALIAIIAVALAGVKALGVNVESGLWMVAAIMGEIIVLVGVFALLFLLFKTSKINPETFLRIGEMVKSIAGAIVILGIVAAALAVINDTFQVDIWKGIGMMSVLAAAMIVIVGVFAAIANVLEGSGNGATQKSGVKKIISKLGALILIAGALFGLIQLIQSLQYLNGLTLENAVVLAVPLLFVAGMVMLVSKLAAVPMPFLWQALIVVGVIALLLVTIMEVMKEWSKVQLRHKMIDSGLFDSIDDINALADALNNSFDRYGDAIEDGLGTIDDKKRELENEVNGQFQGQKKGGFFDNIASFFGNGLDGLFNVKTPTASELGLGDLVKYFDFDLPSAIGNAGYSYESFMSTLANSGYDISLLDGVDFGSAEFAQILDDMGVKLEDFGINDIGAFTSNVNDAFGTVEQNGGMLNGVIDALGQRFDPTGELRTNLKGFLDKVAEDGPKALESVTGADGAIEKLTGENGLITNMNTSLFGEDGLLTNAKKMVAGGLPNIIRAAFGLDSNTKDEDITKEVTTKLSSMASTAITEATGQPTIKAAIASAASEAGHSFANKVLDAIKERMDPVNLVNATFGNLTVGLTKMIFPEAVLEQAAGEQVAAYNAAVDKGLETGGGSKLKRNVFPTYEELHAMVADYGFEELGEEAVHKVVTAISTYAAANKTTAREAFWAILKGAGDDTIDGLVEELNARKEDKIGPTIELLGTDIKEGFKATQEINSPSKVWMGFGDDMVNGLDIGFTTAIKMLTVSIGKRVLLLNSKAALKSAAFLSTGILLAATLKKGFETVNFSSSGGEAADSLGNGFWNKIQNTPNLGVSFVNSIINGVLNGRIALENAGRNAANSFVNAYNNAMQAGLYAQGVQNGDIAVSTKLSPTNADIITDSVAGAFNTNYTSRLANVTASMSDAAIAYKASQNNKYNDQNVINAIGGLQGDVRDLKNTIGTMGVYLDGKTLAGKLTTGIDRNLGQNQMMQRRSSL